MSTEDDTLSADEQAYFENGGAAAAPVPEKPATEALSPENEPSDDLDAVEGAVDGDQRQDQRVPLKTLLEERKQAKEARQRLAEIEKQQAVWQERWRLLEQASAQQAKPEPKDEDPEPDPQQDIFAHQAWISRQIAKEREARLQIEQQSAQQRQAAEFESKVWQYWQGSAAEFATTATDFPDAAGFLAEARDKQLKALASINPHLATKEGRDRVVNEELKQIIVAAAQQQRSPAEIIYGMAKDWGYTPKQAQAAAEDAGKAIEALAANVEGAKSLSSVAGGRPESNSAASVADMSDREFEAWYAKPENQAKFKRMQGA